jgi:mRNA-degrading endonuclease RelE of RelBE toxin-antitoxin system
MYQFERTEECKRQISKLTFKNKALEEALRKKIDKILENPYHFKPLGNIMSGARRVHVLKCFVLTYSIDEGSKTVLFRKFSHHDEAY